jgi:hypothetical protein
MQTFFLPQIGMSQKRKLCEDGLDLNTLRADIAHVCKQLRIPYVYAELKDYQYLSEILIQISIISNVMLTCGEKVREDVRAFIDQVFETLELKSRDRPVKKAKYIVIIVDAIIPPDFDDYDYPTVDSIPGCLDYYGQSAHFTKVDFEEMCDVNPGMNRRHVDQANVNGQVADDRERESTLAIHQYDFSDLAESLKRLGW